MRGNQSNQCVICGLPISEGSQVCPWCLDVEPKTRRTYNYTANKGSSNNKKPSSKTSVSFWQRIKNYLKTLF